MGNFQNRTKKNKRNARNWRKIIRMRKPKKSVGVSETVENDESKQNHISNVEDILNSNFKNDDITDTKEEVVVIIGCGMKNLGQSCFFNACFQALFHIPIVNIRLQMVQNEKCTCVMTAITKCFKKTHTKEKLTQVSPRQLYIVMKRRNQDLLNGKVQDAHMFWMRIISSIEELKCCQEMKGLFLHKFTSLVKCEICDHESEIDYETTAHVVQFQGKNTIDEAINDYFLEETVEDYVCPNCLQHSSTKSHWFKSAPHCLVFVLNRFDSGFKKINDHIELTERLDLSDKILTDEDVRLNYSLVSTINHYGSTGSHGHYTAISSHADAIYEFDDVDVRSVDGFTAVTFTAVLTY